MKRHRRSRAILVLVLLAGCGDGGDSGPLDGSGAGGKADDSNAQMFDHAAAFSECLASFDAQMDNAQRTGEMVGAHEFLIECRHNANVDAAATLDAAFESDHWPGAALVESVDAQTEAGGAFCALISATMGFPPSSTNALLGHVVCQSNVEGGIGSRLQAYSAIGDASQRGDDTCSDIEVSGAAELLGDSVIAMHEAVDGLDLPPTTPTMDTLRAAGAQTCDLSARTTGEGPGTARCCHIAQLQQLTTLIDDALLF